MAIEKRQVDVAKELDDCMVLVVALVNDIKAGKAPGEIISGNIPALMAAMNGVDQVAVELKSNRRAAFETIGLRSADLMDALLGKVVPV